MNLRVLSRWPFIRPAEPSSEPVADRQQSLREDERNLLTRRNREMDQLDLDHQEGRISSVEWAAARQELEQFDRAVHCRR